MKILTKYFSRQYIYFVAYNYAEGETWGIGNVEVFTDRKIDSIDEVRETEEVLKKDLGVNNLAITSFQLLK